MDEEQYLRREIALLQAEYRTAVRPYLDRLVKIEAARPLPPIIIPDLSPALREIAVAATRLMLKDSAPTDNPPLAC